MNYLILLLFSFNTLASTAIGTINSSYHWDKTISYNEQHNGVYIRVADIAVGRYVNSYNQESNFISYDMKRFFKSKSIEAYPTIALADNYTDRNRSLNGYLPIIGISARCYAIKIMVTPIGVITGLEVNF